MSLITKKNSNTIDNEVIEKQWPELPFSFQVAFLIFCSGCADVRLDLRLSACVRHFGCERKPVFSGLVLHGCVFYLIVRAIITCAIKKNKKIHVE
jgi:hypothetical protein